MFNAYECLFHILFIYTEQMRIWDSQTYSNDFFLDAADGQNFASKWHFASHCEVLLDWHTHC